MATLTFSNALLPLAGTDKAEKVEAAKPGFLVRAYNALIESRRRSAEREIARLEMIYGLNFRGEETAAKRETADLPFGG